MVEKKDTSAPLSVQPISNNQSQTTNYASGTPSVAAAKIMAENSISANQLNGTGKDGRITKQDVLAALSNGLPTAQAVLSNSWQGGRDKERAKMTSLRSFNTTSPGEVSMSEQNGKLATLPVKFMHQMQNVSFCCLNFQKSALMKKCILFFN